MPWGEIAAPTTSEGVKTPREDATPEAPAIGVGDGGQSKEEAGRAEQDVIFLVLGVFCHFLCLVELGGRGSGNPAMIDHFDLGRDMVKGGKMVAAARKAAASRCHGPSGRM